MRLRAGLELHKGSTSEAGLFILFVVVPLIFVPSSAVAFSAPKLVALVGGALVIALGRPSIDRRLATVSAIWVLVLCAATIFGLDPWWSLLGPENMGTGVLTLGVCAMLLCVGGSVSDELLDRAASWLFWTGVIVSTVAVIGRFGGIGAAHWRLGWHTSTIGHRIFVGGFIAASVLAGTVIRRNVPFYLASLVLGSGLAVTAVRSAWLGAGLGLIVVLLVGRNRRAVFGVLVPLVIAISVWTLADRVVPERDELGFSAVSRFAEVTEGTGEERIHAMRAYLRAWKNDPILGSGPSTGWYGFLQNASTEEHRGTERGFGDGHNIVVEMASTTGTVGASALFALGGLTLLRARRTPVQRSWVLGAAISLGVLHLFQPLNIVLTPLLFLTAGLALPAESRAPLRMPTWVSVVLVLGVIAVSARFVAASLEWYGLTYASEDALRWAVRLDPLRLGAPWQLARHRAFDHRSGDRSAADEARAAVGRTVSAHPWHPAVRLVAADIELVLDDEAGARRWTKQHLEIFPNDALALGGAAALANRQGAYEEAKKLAERALALDPELQLARDALDKATAKLSRRSGKH